jgi:hypothetical protein
VPHWLRVGAVNDHYPTLDRFEALWHSVRLSGWRHRVDQWTLGQRPTAFPAHASCTKKRSTMPLLLSLVLGRERAVSDGVGSLEIRSTTGELE